MVAPSSSPAAASGSFLVKECGRGAEGTSLPLVGSISASVSSSSVPSSFLGSSLSLSVPSFPLSMEPCRGEVGLSSSSSGSSSYLIPNLSSVVPSMPSVMETSELSSSIGMPSNGKVACEQLSLLVRKMELADGRKSWSEIVESVIVVELGTLTGSEAEDRLSLKTLPVVSSSSSLVKKIMLETVREHEQMQLAKSSQARESSSETTSFYDGSSYSSSHSEESADGADSESDNAAIDDRRDDDVENVDVEDDGALGSADDEQNRTGDVNVGEESEQHKFASDDNYDAVGDDEMGDRDGFDERSDFSGERDDFSDEQDSFSGEQSGVSGSLGIAVVGDGRDDADGGSDRRADVIDILRKIKQESVAASLADSLDAFGDPCGYVKKKKTRVRKARERPRSFIGHHLVGVPLAPGDTCWRKMDLSEIPSLVDCFAGGSADTFVVESGTTGVELSASARSIVMGLTSTTAPVPPAGVSGKKVVAGSEKVVKKRVAAGRSSKDAPASKSRKVASSDVELPLVIESPAAEKATFEPFEHSFNGLSSGCGDLLKLFQSPGGVDGLPFDQLREGVTSMRCRNWKGSAKFYYEDIISIETDFASTGFVFPYISSTGNGNIIVDAGFERDDEMNNERVDLINDMNRKKYDWSKHVWGYQETVQPYAYSSEEDGSKEEEAGETSDCGMEEEIETAHVSPSKKRKN
ncbi:hypothetical protein Bca52824_086842 [Brassica carinata]|uniref:Uncharacterized protein n=1 Tax=Brassica carinata TaxID=52824 RepID=A0A8X7TML7_BRACI|nr:hypothetical protein Bca52824_086842 [Brassica carinata]